MSAPEFVPIQYAFDGQEVYIRWSREKRNLLRCKVACAAGNMARIVNEKYGVDKWMSLDDLLTPTEEIARRVMDT